jgi:hypothetical protein
MSFLRLERHLREEDLLLLQEGELSLRKSKRAAAHLRDCASCRARKAALMLSANKLREIRVATLKAESSDRLRNDLSARLAQAAGEGRKDTWFKRLRQPVTLLRFASVTVLLVASMVWQTYRPLQDLMSPYEETGPKPVRALTPGAVRPAALSELCRLPDNDLDPTVPADKQRAVFRAYGMSDRAAHAYQVDYLINPQLGGDDALENLWPEPYHATVWNATAKDALETRMHSMVCGGQLDLVAAQREIATDWIAAYKKYFHADRPVSTVAAADRLPAWQR